MIPFLNIRYKIIKNSQKKEKTFFSANFLSGLRCPWHYQYNWPIKHHKVVNNFLIGLFFSIPRSQSDSFWCSSRNKSSLPVHLPACHWTAAVYWWGEINNMAAEERPIITCEYKQSNHAKSPRKRVSLLLFVFLPPVTKPWPIYAYISLLCFFACLYH